MKDTSPEYVRQARELREHLAEINKLISELKKSGVSVYLQYPVNSSEIVATISRYEQL